MHRWLAVRDDGQFDCNLIPSQLDLTMLARGMRAIVDIDCNIKP